MDGLEKNTTFELPVTSKKLDHNREPSFTVLGDHEAVFEEFDRLQEEGRPQQFYLKSNQPQKDADYYYRSGLLLVDSGEYGLAKNLFLESLALDPCHADSLRWLGWCEQMLGDLDQAECCYEQLSILRGNPVDLFEYGNVLYALKKFDEALQVWFQASRNLEGEDPLLFDIYKNLGNGFVHLTDFDSAEENFNKALSLRPDSDVLQVNFGTLAFQQGKFQIAEEHFRKANELNPQNHMAWVGLALVARQEGDTERAYSLLLKALDMKADSLQALHVFVRWSQDDGRPELSEISLRKYLQAHPDDSDIHYSLAGLLFQSGKLQEAQAEVEAILQRKPIDTKALELKTLILREMERYGRN